jgi:hypothetical protein
MHLLLEDVAPPQPAVHRLGGELTGMRLESRFPSEVMDVPASDRLATRDGLMGNTHPIVCNADDP